MKDRYGHRIRIGDNVVVVYERSCGGLLAFVARIVNFDPIVVKDQKFNLTVQFFDHQELHRTNEGWIEWFPKQRKRQEQKMMLMRLQGIEIDSL